MVVHIENRKFLDEGWQGTARALEHNFDLACNACRTACGPCYGGYRRSRAMSHHRRSLRGLKSMHQTFWKTQLLLVRLRQMLHWEIMLPMSDNL